MQKAYLFKYQFVKKEGIQDIRTYIIFFSLFIIPFQSVLAQDDEKPARIWNVKMEGNNTYNDIVLKKYIANEAPSFWKKLTFFNETGYYVSEKEIRRDVIRLERFYQRRGFNEVKVDYRLESKNKEWKKELIFMVVENAPIRIDTVQVLTQTSMADSTVIYNSEEFQKELNRLPFRKGKVFQPVLKPEVESEFAGILRNLGFPYASAEVQSKVDTTAKKASVAILNYPGPRAKFDSIKVEGEETIDEKYIVRETGFSDDEYFSDDKMREAQRELFGHHFYRFALISIPEQQQDTTVDVLIRVRERSLRSVALTFGVGNYDRFDDQRLSISNFYKLLRAQATWSYRNARGKGELFQTSAKLSAFDIRLGASYLFPYVYNTKSSITIAPFVQRRIERAYSIDTGGIRNSLGYNYSENVTGTFSYDFTLNREFDVEEDENGNSALSPDSVLNYNISSFKFNVYARKGSPRRGNGFVVQPFLELSGLFNEASFSFQKASLDLRGYKKLNESLTAAARVSGGTIYYAKQDSLPADIRFYNGGSSEVRGWGRQELGPKEAVFDDSTGTFSGYVPTGGKATFNFNFELRQDIDRLIKGLSIAGFIDGGQVWRTIKTTDERPIQFGTGGGFRYESPIGPIRVDLAYKINPTDADLNIYQGDDSQSGFWDRWRIHFSIGQAF